MQIGEPSETVYMKKARNGSHQKKISNSSNTPWFNNKMKRLVSKKDKTKKHEQVGKLTIWPHTKSTCQKALLNQQWDYTNTIIDTTLEQNDVKPLCLEVKKTRQHLGITNKTRANHSQTAKQKQNS